MSKILILTSQKRVKRFFDLTTLPEDFELIFAEELKTDDEILERAFDADFIFADAIQEVSRKLIEGMPHLKLIHSEGVGYNKIDLEAAKERGIFVCNNAAANAVCVAEHAIMLMLAVHKRLLEGDMMVRTGRQIQAKGAFIMDGLPELSSCNVGLIGFGMIAKETAKRLKAFGCEISYFDIKRDEENEEALGVSYRSADEIIKNCDIISLHLPVTPKTIGFIDKKKFAMMKPSALLINTARGEIVVQEDLVDALTNGKIAGAGLDTLYPEPVLADNPLLALPEECRYKVLFTPHTAGGSLQALQKMHTTTWSNIIAVTEGKRPINIVNGL